jgi:hypothetical protein
MNKYWPSYNKHTGIWTEIDAITKKITKKGFLIFLPNNDDWKRLKLLNMFNELVFHRWGWSLECLNRATCNYGLWQSGSR